MRTTLIIVLLSVLHLPVMGQEQSTEDHSTTVYYLIRHAEKDRSDETNKNPGLTTKGFFRADRWAKTFSAVELDAIYSSNYDRTLMTASPTAKDQELEIRIYDPRDLNNAEFKEATEGKTVLVVGHSNTTPAFVNAIIGEDRYEDMDDSDNGSLYMVTKIGETTSVQILKMN